MEDLRVGNPPSGGKPPPVGGCGPRWAIIGIFLLMVVAALALGRSFLTPTVLAFLLALVFSPPRRALERIGIGSALSAFLLTAVLLGLVAAAVVALAGPISQWAQDAQLIGQQIEWKLRDLRGVAEQVQEAARRLDELAAAGADGRAQRVVVEGPGVAGSLAVTAPGVAAQVLFTLLLLFFLLASGDMFYEKVVAAMPTFSDKRRAIRIARDVERKLSRYLFTITVINAGLGVAIGLAMWLVGMPNPLLLGVIAFLVNYIPYVGSVIGVATAAMVGLVSLPTAWDAALAAGLWFALTAVEGQLITPVFVGRNLRLNTVVVFLSVSFWAWLWSVVGMLVATPLLVTVRVFCEHVPSLEPIGTFLSARGAERPDAGEEDG